jgi:O-antigen ligase
MRIFDFLSRITYAYDIISLLVLAAITVVAVVGIAFWCKRRYEIAVFLVAVSPLITGIFIPNIPVVAGEQAPNIGSYIRVSLLLLIGIIGIMQFFRLKSTVQQGFPFHFILFGVFLLLALISTTYSIDRYYTFIRSSSSIAFFGFLLGLYYWLQDKQRLDQTINSLFLVVCVITIINTISLVFLSERVWHIDSNRFQGLWGSPNVMGRFCMISYPILLWKYSRSNLFKKWIIVVLISLLAFLHLLTGSRASLIGSIFGLCIWFVVLKKKVKLMLLLGITCVLAFCVVQFEPPSFHREGGIGLMDLNERGEYWCGCYKLIMEKPILGYGYAVGGEIWEDPQFYNPASPLWSGSPRSSLHNGYLSIAIGVGIVGFAVWCIMLLIPFWRCRLLCCSDYKAFVITIMSMCLLVNFVENTIIATGGSLAAIVFWIALVLAERLKYTYANNK